MHTFVIEVVNDGWQWRGEVEAENHVLAVRRVLSELQQAEDLAIPTPLGLFTFDFDNLDPQWWIDGILYEVDICGDAEHGMEPIVHPARLLYP